MMSFPEFMRAARGDMSLYKLARRTGITAQQLANYERGRSKATVDKAAARIWTLLLTAIYGVATYAVVWLLHLAGLF